MVSACPDLAHLHSFVLGRMSDADAEPIGQHLGQCSLCVQQLQQLPQDPLLRVMRALDSATPLPDTSQVDLLIGRLRQLALLHVAQDTAVPETANRQAADLPIPESLGRYRIRRRLGAGGMGTVYEAFDPELKRVVAIKVPRFTGRPEEEPARQRFLREAQAAAAIRHPHVCAVYDVGVQDGQPFVVMAYIAGQSLAEHLRQHGPYQDARLAVRLISQVARALAAVHEHGIVHRDLKPGNILLDRAGQAVLTDFGVARVVDEQALTQEGMAVGTPAYMAPEQLVPRLGEVDARADIYSLGVVLYQMLTGRLPLPEPKPESGRPVLEPALEPILQIAMAWKPADRFPSAREMAIVLEGWLDLDQGATPSPPRLLRGYAKLALTAALLLLGLPALYFIVNRPAPSPTDLVPTASETATPSAGWVDVRIWEPGNDRRHGIRLNHAGALPLKLGDQIRIEAEVNQPAYLYVLWIDTAGKSWPVYPWTPGKWQDRPAQEQPARRLSLPEQADGGWPIEAGLAGMDTLVLLARETPLPADLDLAALLADLPVQTAQSLQSAVWFENGDVVRREADRAPNFFNPQRLDDPMLRTQAIMKQQLGPHFRWSRSVSFAVQGK